MTAATYEASPIRRTRATKAEVEARREALLDIIEESLPPLRLGPVPRHLSLHARRFNPARNS
jgi:hypothetical protein